MPDDQGKQEGFGDMTRAWFDAGSEVADFEAGKIAERRRLLLATAGIIVAIGLIAAAIVFALF